MSKITNDEPAPEFSIDAPALADNPRLKAALAYVKLGLRVIPLHDRRKEPRLKQWGKKATTDPLVVRTWFRDWPESNIGIVTGKGLVVLDVDPKNGGPESLDKLIATNGPLPPTAEARTGSGGSHYFFMVEPSTTVKNRTCFLPGLDIRGDGGYVVAAPSVHPDTGAEYEWVTHPDQGMAPIPSWLLSIITAPTNAVGRVPAKRTSTQRAKYKAKRPPVGRQARPRSATGPRTREHSGMQDKAIARQPGPLVGKTSKNIDRDARLAEIIQRFAVPNVGHRHNLMVRAVGGMVGGGVDDNTIIKLMLAWHEHFFDQGKIGSDRETMEDELIKCLRRTHDNPDFRPSHSQAFYESAYAKYVLPEHVMVALGAKLEDLIEAKERPSELQVPGPYPMELPHNPSSYKHCTRVTRGSRIRIRLCDSKDERLFIEALLAVVSWKLKHTAETTLTLTNDQLRQVVSKRFKIDMPVWDNKQIVRLKQKYVNRLSPNGNREPARVFELLRELRRGHKGKGMAKGSPSEYELTGIKILLQGVAGSGLHEAGVRKITLRRGFSLGPRPHILCNPLSDMEPGHQGDEQDKEPKHRPGLVRQIHIQVSGNAEAGVEEVKGDQSHQTIDPAHQQESLQSRVRSEPVSMPSHPRADRVGDREAG